MKPILAVIGGFVLSFGLFIAGIFFALFVVADEPPQQPRATENIAEVWTSEPRTVNVPAQATAFERLPPAQQRGFGPAGTAAAAEGVQPPVDSMMTAAISPGEQETIPGQATVESVAAQASAARVRTAHAEWCARRYRSYDAGTDSYRPHGGGRRLCISPYRKELGVLTGNPAPALADEKSVEEGVVIYEYLPVVTEKKRLSIRPPTRVVARGVAAYNFDRSGR